MIHAADVNPFRLLGSSDWSKLDEYRKALENDVSAYHPNVTISMDKLIAFPDIKDCYQAMSSGQSLMLFNFTAMQNLIRHILQEDADDLTYSSASQTLFERLFCKFFSVDALLFSKVNHTPEWNYPGSPCIELRFDLQDKTLISIIINPAWVCNRLGTIHQPKKVSYTFDEIIGNQALTVKSCLPASNTSIRQLLSLQVGDVLELDVLSTSLIDLQYQQKPIAKISHGVCNGHKAVKIQGAYHE